LFAPGLRRINWEIKRGPGEGKNNKNLKGFPLMAMVSMRQEIKELWKR